jgi:hypothetical protein
VSYIWTDDNELIPTHDARLAMAMLLALVKDVEDDVRAKEILQEVVEAVMETRREEWA